MNTITFFLNDKHGCSIMHAATRANELRHIQPQSNRQR
jgi:hypothetical protein